MNNKGKMLLVGSTMFGVGVFVGWKALKKTITLMVNDRKFMEDKILPVLEKKIGKEKLKRMTEIYYEKGEEVK